MTKVKTTKPGNCTRIVSSIATTLGFNDPLEICPNEMKEAREAAFLSKDPDEFAFWYLKSEVFSKFRSASDGGQELREAALDRFWEAEVACMAATPRLIGPSEVNPSIPTTLIPAINRARRWVERVLGPFDINELPNHIGWGPGATTEFSRRRATRSNKWEFSTHVTPAAEPYAWAIREWLGLRSFMDLPELSPVLGNKVTTVPKSYKTDRTIAIEPTWNAFLQKGLGGMIRARLNRLGLLTPDAQHRNRVAACEGSLTGELATIDLSSASDTVSIALCELLLPADWFRAVDDLRSHYFSTQGLMLDWSAMFRDDRDGMPPWVPYDKISSMGCGFTFELETLLFQALTVAASGKGNTRGVRAYGDDIICNTDDYEAVSALLAHAGFKQNAEKSFATGPFRESCGGHYWHGLDVTPFYIKEVPTLLSQVIEIANKLLGWSCLRVDSKEHPGLPRLLRESWLLAYRSIPRAFRGPFGLPGCVWTNWDLATPSYDASTQSWRVLRCQRKVLMHDESDRLGALAEALSVKRMEAQLRRNSPFSPLMGAEWWTKDEDPLTDIQASSRRTGLERDVVSRAWVPSTRWSTLPVSW